MKKLTFILLALSLVALCAAIEFEFDGENRTRAAFYNDMSEDDGGHVDNQAYLGMNAHLHDNLMMRVNLQFGDVTWGDDEYYPYWDKSSWGGITSAVDIKAYELYVDYRIEAIQSNIRVGQQYWCDHMSLILDDSFSGVMLQMDDLGGFQTDLGWIKVNEYDPLEKDDYNYFLVNMQTAETIPMGVLASFAHDADMDYSTLTLMPNVSLQADPLSIDAAAFMGVHFFDEADNKVGLGAAVKANADLGGLNVGADLLFATENGIETLSPYYMNGLYIYGIGRHHDGVNLYWDWAGPYNFNADTFLSFVGQIGAPITEKIGFFGAAGYLLDEGFEINAGLEYDIIPDLMQLAGYAAMGWHEDFEYGEKSDGPTNYVLGTTLFIAF
jgi:hypothetical protein